MAPPSRPFVRTRSVGRASRSRRAIGRRSQSSSRGLPSSSVGDEPPLPCPRLAFAVALLLHPKRLLGHCGLVADPLNADSELHFASIATQAFDRGVARGGWYR